MQAADLAGAESGFVELLRLQPAFYPASVGLGYTLLARGKPKEALARFDAAAAQAPRYGPALAGRAEALIAAGDRDAALAAFEAAIAADPEPRRPRPADRRAETRPAPGSHRLGQAGGRCRPSRRGARRVCGRPGPLARHRVPAPGPRPGRTAAQEPPGGRTPPPQGAGAGPCGHRCAHRPRRRARTTGEPGRRPSRPSSARCDRTLRRTQAAPRPTPRTRPDRRPAAGIRRHPAAGAGHPRRPGRA